MTIASELATLGQYNTTDITNIVLEAISQITLLNKNTVAEDDSEDINALIKQYAIYLLDRLSKQRKSLSDNSIDILPLVPSWLRKEFEVQKKNPALTDNVILGKYATQNQYGVNL